MRILHNHDCNNPIGTIEMVYDCLEVKFFDIYKISKSNFFKIFGNCGVKVLDSYYEDDIMYIKRASIKEFSTTQTGIDLNLGE